MPKTRWKQSKDWKSLPPGIGSMPSAPERTGCGKRDYGPPKISSGKRPKSARNFFRATASKSRSPLCRGAGEKHPMTSETLITAPDGEWHRPLRFRRTACVRLCLRFEGGGHVLRLVLAREVTSLL